MNRNEKYIENVMKWIDLLGRSRFVRGLQKYR